MRSSFWPTVLVGAGASALAAVAAGQRWATGAESADGFTPQEALKGSEAAPLALALALVALAAWGAILVLRRRGRQVVAVIGAVASLGTVAAVLRGRQTLTRELTDADLSLWFAVTAVAAGIAVLAFGAATLKAAVWPEMSAKYDAPGDRAPDQTDLWKALDEGHDPTA